MSCTRTAAQARSNAASTRTSSCSTATSCASPRPDHGHEGAADHGRREGGLRGEAVPLTGAAGGSSRPPGGFIFTSRSRPTVRGVSRARLREPAAPPLRRRLLAGGAVAARRAAAAAPRAVHGLRHVQSRAVRRPDGDLRSARRPGHRVRAVRDALDRASSSEPIGNAELAYFFCALVLALVNGLPVNAEPLVIGLNVLVLLTLAFVDHPALYRRTARQRVVLDTVLASPAELRAELERRLGVEVVEVTVEEVDFVREITRVTVRHLRRPESLSLNQRPRSRRERPALRGRGALDGCPRSISGALEADAALAVRTDREHVLGWADVKRLLEVAARRPTRRSRSGAGGRSPTTPPTSTPRTSPASARTSRAGAAATSAGRGSTRTRAGAAGGQAARRRRPDGEAAPGGGGARPWMPRRGRAAHSWAIVSARVPEVAADAAGPAHAGDARRGRRALHAGLRPSLCRWRRPRAWAGDRREQVRARPRHRRPRAARDGQTPHALQQVLPRHRAAAPCRGSRRNFAPLMRRCTAA